MSGKGDKRRPGTGFEAGYDGIDWGRKEEPTKPAECANGCPPETICEFCQGPGGPDNAPEGQQATGWPPGLLQDDSYPLAHALSSKPDARQHVRDVAGQSTKLVEWPTSIEMLEFFRANVAAMVQEKYPAMQGYLGPRIHGNFRCKINDQDSGLDSGFEVLTKIGMDYVLEAIEPPAKTCQGCKHWSEANQPAGFGCCLNEAIGAYHERGESRVWLVPPADFGCSMWEPKP